MLQIPQQHNLPHSLINDVSEKTGCSVPYWEISVQRKDDIAWSIVLSYLISAKYRKGEDDFAERLKTLTGSDANLNLVRKSIRSFNPFRNRHACFYNKNLKQVVHQFKTNLSWDSLSSVSKKLSSASAILCCPILLIWKKGTDIKHHIYPGKTETPLKIIALYACNITNNENRTPVTVYNFLLDNELGFRLKKAALVYYLKEAKIPWKVIRRIESEVKEGKHFLISILTSTYGKHLIPKVYKSAYIVSKIAQAGYETDPRTKDSEGLSGFYHALVLGDVVTLYELYYFAANNCFQSEGTFRNPDSPIVANLLQMEKILSNDLAKSQDFSHHPSCNDFKKAFLDLLKLNKFLIGINSKLLKIKEELNNESANEIIFEARKRREIILSVLDTYVAYFTSVQEDNTDELLDDYVMFKNYYFSIDMATAIIFFDNIMLLKERLTLADDNQYSAIESSFYFSIYYHQVFNPPYVNKTSYPCLEKHKNSIYIFHLIRRLENLDKIKEFSKYLHDTIINKNNVVKRVPENEIYGTLKFYPIIKDCLERSRLEFYVQTALSVKLTDINSVLIIERVLQVIGDYITPEKANDHSFRRLLALILPKNVWYILHRTRHEMCHLKSYSFTSKVECEKKLSLFRSIQAEIHSIAKYLQLVFRIQKLSEVNDVIKRFKEELEKSKMLSISPVYSFKKYEARIKNEENLRSDMLKYCSTFYPQIFRIIICRVENDIPIEIDKSRDLKDGKEKILNTLWPLMWLIELLTECGEHRLSTSFDVFETLKNCDVNVDSINDLKEKAKNCLTTCKDLVSKLTTGRKERKLRPLESIENTERFLKVLKGFVYLTDEEKDEIRKEIPENIKESVSLKEKLMKSAEEGFSLKLDEETSKFEISYLSKRQMETCRELYESESPRVLDILKTPDPIAELEDIFEKNLVDKKKCETLCTMMQFSEKTKKILGRLRAGQRKKIQGNSLSNLLNRVQLMKKILIEENKEIFNLWMNAKSLTSRKYITDKIMGYYLKDPHLQASAEMLLLDCVTIYKNQKDIRQNPWIKLSKLYCGINLHCVIRHGHPILENVCKMLDPEDLQSHMIEKMLRLIEDEDAISAILELYERVNNDFTEVQQILNTDVERDHLGLKNRIVKCSDWKFYAVLLPYDRQP